MNNQLNINEQSLVFNIYSNISFIQDQLKINNWPKYLALINVFMINWLHDEMVSWWVDFMMSWFHDEVVWW